MSLKRRIVLWAAGILALGGLVFWVVSKLLELDYQTDVALEEKHCSQVPLVEIAGLAATFKKVKGKAPVSIAEAEDWSKREAGMRLSLDRNCAIHDIKLKDKGKSFEVSFKARGRFIREAKGEYRWDEEALTAGWLFSYEARQREKQKR